MSKYLSGFLTQTSAVSDVSSKLFSSSYCCYGNRAADSKPIKTFYCSQL